MVVPVTRRNLFQWMLGMALPAKKSATALLADAVSKQHLTGAGHPERPERFDAVVSSFQKAGLTDRLAKIEPRSATEEEILYCHRREYLQVVKRDAARGARELSTGDTSMGPGSLEVA